MTLPNWLITGMPKCGTTSLVQNLVGHPEIWMSTPDKPARVKGRTSRCAYHEEVQFFDLKYDLGLDWYESLFEGAEGHKVVCEKSPHYMNCLANDALIRILKDIPNTNMIMCMRDPLPRNDVKVP